MMAIRPPTSPTTVMGGFSLGINTRNRNNERNSENCSTYIIKTQPFSMSCIIKKISVCERLYIYLHIAYWVTGFIVVSVCECLPYMVSPCWGEWLRWFWRWAGSVGRLPGLTLHPELHRGSLLYPGAAARQMIEPCTRTHTHKNLNTMATLLTLNTYNARSSKALRVNRK